MATLNQRKVFDKVTKKVAKGEKVAISREMRGIYSDSTATKPHKLTKSKGWAELMEKFLPDELIAKKHRELLNAEVKMTTKKQGEIIYETNRMDVEAVKAGVDMGYKIKKRYGTEEDKKPFVNINIGIFSPEMLAIKEKYESELKEIEKK